MRIIYTATRPIVHSLGQSVTLQIGARTASPRFRRYGVQVRSRDGGRYSELDRIERRYNFGTTRIYDGPTRPSPEVPTLQEFEEFLNSTANFEAFSWDQYGRSTPDNPIQVFRRDSTTTLRRIMRTRYFRTTVQIEAI